MTEDTNPHRLPANATMHSVDERGIATWMQPFEGGLVAIAQVMVRDENNEAAWIKQGVIPDLVAPQPPEVLIAEARMLVGRALDYIERHGPKAYKAECERQVAELEENSPKGE